MTKKLYLIIFAFAIISAVSAQSLPRRAYVGIRMENLTRDARNLIGLKEDYGVLIADVFPNSTAEAAGIKKGDILLKLGKNQCKTTEDVLTFLSAETTGTNLDFEIFRNKKTLKLKSTLKEFPKEKYNDIEVIYSESKSDIGLQRIIITKSVKQTDKKMPVVAFIGGIGCYSLDLPTDTSRSELQLLNSLTRSGFICARLEKPGMGDNAKYCKACNQVSFKEEMIGYVNAIKELKKRNDVDSNQVFIIGHSMGGVFAPLIAELTSIKGIIAYGTLGSNFIEYLAKTRRTIGEAFNMDPIETDLLVKEFCECAHYYFVEKMTTKEAAGKKSICGEYMELFDLRSRAYNDELFAFSIPQLWKTYKGQALLVWGESDYISAKDDHQIITNAINYYHPGHAEFITIPDADHGMYVATSFQTAASNKGPYNSNAGESILTWLQSQI